MGIRICVDARVGRSAGGVQQWVQGVAAGLAALDDGDAYLFLLKRGAGWLAPGGRIEVAIARTSPANRARRLGFRLRRALGGPRDAPLLPSDGQAESWGAQVIHFPTQSGFLTRIPSVYQPHDLAHLHLPGLFDPAESARREREYRALCAQARFVVTGTSFTRDDFVTRYGLDPARVVVVPFAAPTATSAAPAPEAMAALRARLGGLETFALYPAQAWPHKNHDNLLRALAKLRRQGLVVPLVCTGHPNERQPAVERLAADLGLADQVRFLGFVSPEEVRGLYQAARIAVFASRFEGFGMPILEAFHAGVPLCCSSAPSLRGLAADATEPFPPEDVPAMARALGRLWTDEARRAELVKRGRERVALFTWERSALLLRALYRTAAGAATGEDLRLLAARPVV
jgi:glycosyltransferase involved in cell wall biosynthesis